MPWGIESNLQGPGNGPGNGRQTTLSSFFATSKPALSLTRDHSGLQSSKDGKQGSREGRRIQSLDSRNQTATPDSLGQSRPPAIRHHLVRILTRFPWRVMGADARDTSTLATELG